MSRRFARVRGGSAAAAAAVTTSISPTSVTQYDDAFALTVNGGNFTAGSIISVAGTPRTTTFISSSQVTCIVPRGDRSTSVLWTSGSKSITVDGSNAQTLTVTAWDFDTPSGLTVCLDPANYDASTGTWSGSLGAPNFAQSTAGFRPAKDSAYAPFNGLPAVNADGVDDFLLGPALSSVITNTTHNIYCVLNSGTIPSTSADEEIAKNASPWTDSYGYIGLSLRSVPDVSLFNYDVTPVDLVTVGFAAAATKLIKSRRVGGNMYLRDGDNTESDGVPSGATVVMGGTFQLFRNYEIVGKFYAGRMGHLVAYNVDLSTAHDARVRNKLMGLYNL